MPSRDRLPGRHFAFPTLRIEESRNPGPLVLRPAPPGPLVLRPAPPGPPVLRPADRGHSSRSEDQRSRGAGCQAPPGRSQTSAPGGPAVRDHSSRSEDRRSRGPVLHGQPSHSMMASADFSEKPGRFEISPTLALRIRSTLPNFFSKACFFFGEIAGQSSSRLSFIRRR